MLKIYKYFPELKGLQGLAQMALKMQNATKRRYQKFLDYINGRV